MTQICWWPACRFASNSEILLCGTRRCEVLEIAVQLSQCQRCRQLLRGQLVRLEELGDHRYA